MTARAPCLLVCAALLFALPALAGDTPAEEDDVPSLELLEYLAAFERDDDGRLVDPLDMQRDPTTVAQPRRGDDAGPTR
ncbi:MAG: hypothetical protein QNJ91_14020 [Gammaproteobacteria bacterium]|nr:hypothetical protein [Gammaproteobacteria bacterium]